MPRCVTALWRCGQDHESRVIGIMIQRKINSRLPEKFQTNSGFLDGFWALWDHSGPEGTRLGRSEWPGGQRRPLRVMGSHQGDSWGGTPPARPNRGKVVLGAKLPQIEFLRTPGTGLRMLGESHLGRASLYNLGQNPPRMTRRGRSYPPGHSE